MGNEHENIPGGQENTDTAELKNLNPVPREAESAGADAADNGKEDSFRYHYQQDTYEQGAGQNGYSNPYTTTGYNPNYTQNYNEEGMDTRPLSMGEWALTILALMLPCCAGIILYIVWAFSKRGNVNRRNYCRAALVIMGAAVVIYLVVFMMFGSVIFSTFATQLNVLAG